MALQFSQGAPSDASGVNGDYNLDTQGRFFYGPKASNSWTGVPIFSLVGPTGPSLLSGSGAPASSVGAQGQGYLDVSTGNTYLKSASGWGSAQGNIQGPQGVAGLSGTSVPSLNSTSFAFGPNSANATALALSGTAQFIPAPGTSGQPGYFIPATSCTMVASMFVLSSTNSPGATAFSLYELNTGNTLYSYTISTAGTVVNLTGLNVGLTGGYTYGWRVTGSGNAFVQASPTFSQSSTQPMGLSYAPLFGSTPASAPTTATPLVVAGNTGTVAQYMPMPKTGFLYAAAFTNTASSNATFGLYNQTGTVIYSTTVSSNTTTPTLVGPFGLATNTQLAAGYYTWRVTCSATGYFAVLPQVFM